MKTSKAKIIGSMPKRLKAMFGIVVAVAMLFVFISPRASAEDTSQTFTFELTVDGKDIKEVETGDIITVVLKLKRTDSSQFYTMYAMQDEIRYDSTFFELVEGSAILNSGINSTDIGLVDQYREFYMNYLSMSGGSQWESNMLIGSFQLKVIGTSGVTKITNQDYLVSTQDGSGSFACEANDITVILSTDYIISFETNGGSEIEDRVVRYAEKIIRPEDPVRNGYKLEGWYKDIHLTEEWDFDKDTVEENMTLYAKWIELELGTEPGEVEPDDRNNGFLWLWILFVFLLIAGVYLCLRHVLC